ncbi:MAG: ATP-binding cassette domain-containing protein [Ruminiclostridium sp.]|nr:ATP-binding cassette domain-containing protein [Ruminiclostridium sp.]
MTIKATGICKEFIRQGKNTNRFTAVSPTDITIEPGKMYVLMGRSGSGKTTLLNILAGLLTPTSGKVLYDSEDIYALDDDKLSRFRCEHIGVIPQGQTAIHSLNVIENICLSYMLYGSFTEREAAYPAARELMQRLGIAELEKEMPSALSGGELRRMAIARAMLRKPDVIFADEPTCDLDDENTELMLKTLKETAKSGTAVFVVTHEKDAVGYADINLNMSGGVLTIQ